MRLAFLAALVLLAGCVAPTTPPPGAGDGSSASDWDAIEAAIGAPIGQGQGHDHADPKLHNHSYNLDLVAAVSGEAGRAPQPTEGYVETAVKGGYGYLCRSGPDQGLVIFDLADIEAPKQVGYVKLDAGFEPDIEVSDDGKWAFWETQRFPTSAQTPSLLEPGANLPHGVHIVDISDKANPKWAGYSPTTPDGPHSITYASIAGRHILFQSVYAFAYAYGDAEVPGAQRLVVSELDTSAPVAQLKTLAEYVEPGATGGPGLFPHDVSISTHPVTGQTLAYVAYWDVGVVILDVTDPAKPVKVGVAKDFGPAPYEEVHMARQMDTLIDGRVVVVVEPEIGAQEDSGYMTFLDVTDPTAPTYVSSWLIPGNLTSDGGTLGPHYFDVRDGRVAMASYHAGFWIIDVHDKANLERPRTAGFAEANATRGGGSVPGPLGGFGGLTAFDAWWADATHVVGGDTAAGLVVYRYTGPTPHAV
jgi:hypothetical protein